jgi:GNAT superfamily N-acetyltransferase
MQHSEIYNFALANKSETTRLSDLAHEIWPIAFSKILSTEQIEFMLKWMYDPSKLLEQMNSGHKFYFLTLNEEEIGFVGLEENYPEPEVLRIHKIYLKPNYHGKGLGKFMLKKIEEIARQKSYKGLHLNVNRYNEAVNFYEKSGFETIKVEDIDIGKGFLMEDYVMYKKL